MSVPGSQTVTVIHMVRRTDPDSGKPTRDGRGNAQYDEESTDVSGCSVQPASTSEQTGDGRDQVTADLTVYAPLTWPGGAVDAVLIDGTRYSIQGKPQRWQHPRLGHVIVTVREVSG